MNLIGPLPAFKAPQKKTWHALRAMWWRLANSFDEFRIWIGAKIGRGNPFSRAAWRLSWRPSSPTFWSPSSQTFPLTFLLPSLPSS
jgi:hypothetical protein